MLFPLFSNLLPDAMLTLRETVDIISFFLMFMKTLFKFVVTIKHLSNVWKLLVIHVNARCKLKTNKTGNWK